MEGLLVEANALAAASLLATGIQPTTLTLEQMRLLQQRCLQVVVQQKQQMQAQQMQQMQQSTLAAPSFAQQTPQPLAVDHGTHTPVLDCKVKKKVAILPSKPVSVSVRIVLLPLALIVAAISIQQGPADGLVVAQAQAQAQAGRYEMAHIIKAYRTSSMLHSATVLRVILAVCTCCCKQYITGRGLTHLKRVPIEVTCGNGPTPCRKKINSLNFQPSGFAANDTSFWISFVEYSATGVPLQKFPGPNEATYMEFLGDTLYIIAYNGKGQPALYALDKMGKTSKLLVNHVKPSGGFALFRAAKMLLFTSNRNSLCQLDMQSGECQVITTMMWPEGGRLLTGNDQLALLIVPCTGGSNLFSCSAEGWLHRLGSVTPSAVFGDFCLNSRGNLLFVDQLDKELPRLSLDFQPKGFAVNGTSFWISYDRSIMEYSAAGVCLQSIAGPAGAYMEFWGNTLFTVAYNNKCHPDLCCMDKMGRTIKLLVNHVKPSGSFALFPAAQKLLFISCRNSLCQLDLTSGECRVITPSVWPEGGRLLTGNDQLALLIVPCTGGSNFFSFSAQGELHHLLSMSHSAVNVFLRAMDRIKTLCTLHTPISSSRGMTADCDGSALVCCVYEEGVGWVVKRSKTGAGLATLFSFWISHGRNIMKYSAAGECLQSITGPANAAYMAFLGDTMPVASNEGILRPAEGQAYPQLTKFVSSVTAGLDFEPNGFAVYGPSFWISHGKTIMEYSATGECLKSILGPANAAYMEFLGNTLYTIAYNNKWQAALYGMDKMGRTSKLLANHVQLSGGFALFPAAQILLFTSTHKSLCQLDLQLGECRVITTSFWPKDARLLTGNEQLALLVVFRGGGNDFFSCSSKGELLQLWSMPHSAVNRDYRLNSRGDLLFIDQHDKELPRICCLPALLPPPEASACKTLSPKGSQ
ncbi:hypothetical protein QJQ45_012326 [Haematococcus lacustris]|nr:hypothetical protein QJQ45_012326 [Haematococcus lacustris]